MSYNNKKRLDEDLRIEFMYLRTLEERNFPRDGKLYKRTKDTIKRTLKKRYFNYLDPSIVNHFLGSNHDDEDHCFLIDANNEQEVERILRNSGFDPEGIEYIDRGYDCTGQRFGGEANINKIYEGRYVVYISYSFDV